MSSAPNEESVVRVRSSRAPEKRRSWHVARLASDIQRSIAEQSLKSNDGEKAPYRRADSEPRPGDQQVEKREASTASFSIATWEERPTRPAMDFKVSTSSDDERISQYSSSEADSADNVVLRKNVPPPLILYREEEPPIEAVSVSVFTNNVEPNEPLRLSTDPTLSEEDLANRKRIVSALCDNYIDVVVKELRGAAPCFFPIPA